MIRRFTLSMVLLLSMVAVQNVYADDDPSVVTLYEASFEEGIGDFVSLSSADRKDNNTTNEAWHYNATERCIECSGSETGYLASPLIEVFTERKYCDITLWVEHEGKDANQGNLEMKILKDYDNYWERYQAGASIYPEPNSENQFSSGKCPLDAYAQGRSFRFAIHHDPSSDGYYRIKSIKITARDWTLVEGLHEVNTIAEVTALPEGSLFKLNFNDALVTWSEGDFYYLHDGTSGIQVYTYGFNVPSLPPGGLMSGYVYGEFLKVDEVIPRIYKTTMKVTRSNPGGASSFMPKEITQEQIEENFLNYVKVPVTSQITLWDKNYQLMGNRFGATFDYQPNFETYVTGIPFPTSDGKFKILITNEKSITVMLPNEINTPLGENELGLWAVVNRQFEANKWYSLCLPFQEYFSASEITTAKYVSSTEGNIEFRTSSSWDYGEPFLVKFAQDVDKLEGKIWSVDNNNPAANGEIKFVGTLQTVTPPSGSFYLTAGNTIKPLAAGGKINAFRAYFEPNTVAAARTRSISIDGTVIATGDGTTDIEDILNGRTNDVKGDVYNLNGQKVNINSYEKGIYIINGKKVIK